jgi:hypothetical protein
MIQAEALLALAKWMNQPGGSACRTTLESTCPPRRLKATNPTTALPASLRWASLPTQRRRELDRLLGQMMARLLEAKRLKEVGRD